METYARRHGFGVPLRPGGEKSKRTKASLAGGGGGGMFTSE